MFVIVRCVCGGGGGGGKRTVFSDEELFIVREVGLPARILPFSPVQQKNNTSNVL